MRAQSPLENKEGIWKCRVLYSYSPQYEDELRLVEGETITVLHEVEEGWWKGMLNGKVGMFPSNFVEKIEGSSQDSAQNTAKHEVNGNATEADTKKKPELNGGNHIGSENSAFHVVHLSRGDSDAKKENDSGKNPKSEKTPKSSKIATPVEKEKDKITINIGEDVTRRPSQSSSKGSFDSAVPPPTLPPKPVRELVRVLFPYSTEHDDELELQEGDIVTVLSKELEDVGWWKGELNGKVGVFPDNFVKIISSEENIRPPRPDKHTPQGANHTDGATKNGIDQGPPPIPGKKPPMISEKPMGGSHNGSLDKTSETRDSNESLSLIRERPLVHQTQMRPKGPSNRRPPSQMFLDCQKSPHDEKRNSSQEEKDKSLTNGPNDSNASVDGSQESLPVGVTTEVPWMKELKASQMKKKLLEENDGTSMTPTNPSTTSPLKTSTPISGAKLGKPSVTSPVEASSRSSQKATPTANGSMYSQGPDTSLSDVSGDSRASLALAHNGTQPPLTKRTKGDLSFDEDSLVARVLKEVTPQIKKLESKMSEQQSQHAKQLKLLMNELDDERKKRACMEIEIQRLNKLVSAYANV